MNKLNASIVCLLFVGHAMAQTSNSADMREYLQTRSYVSASDPGWNRMVTPEICAAMKGVGIIECSENHFTALSGFLYNNGMHILAKDMLGKSTKTQNQAIADAIKRNAELFVDGNLTAAAAVRWRM